jgi:hypothetical protein
MSLTSSTQSQNRGVPPVAGLDAARIAASQARANEIFGAPIIPPIDLPSDQAVREDIIAMSQPGAVPEMGAAGMDPSPYAGRERLAPDQFSDNSDLVGPNSGQQVMRGFDREDYEMEQANEAARVADFRQGFQKMGRQFDEQGNVVAGPDYTSAAASLLDAGNTIADRLSPSQSRKFEMADDSHVDRLADSQSTALERITGMGQGYLLTSHKGLMDPQDTSTALGFSVMSKMGLGLQDMETASNVISMGVMSAIAQTKKGDPSKADDSAVDFDSGVVPYQDVFNAAAAMAKPLMEKMGFKETEAGQFDKLVGAYVAGLSKDGLFILNRDQNGKLQATLSDDLLALRGTVGRTAQMVTAKLGRRRATKTPNPSGSLVGEKPMMTKNTVLGTGIATPAADAAKDLMGSTGLQYLTKHKEDMNRELTSVMSNEFMHTSGAYSTHPFADRFGLGLKAYNKILKSATDRPPRDPAKRATFRPDAVAQKIMGEEFQKARFYLEAVNGVNGIVFPEMMHSLSNGRFYVASYDVDWLGSKGIIRDILNFGQRDVVKGKTLFDTEEIARMQSINQRVMSLVGVARDEAFDKLDPADFGALGMMYDAVINYYSVIRPDARLTSFSEMEVIKMYTPELAASLAALGAEYNAMREDPEAFTSDKHANIIAYMAAIPKGERLANLALWDDLFQLQRDEKDPVNRSMGRLVTHTSIADGRQNGLFYQALTFGVDDTAQRLGKFTKPEEKEPLKDMREKAFGDFLGYLRSYNSNEDIVKAWSLFFSAIKEKEFNNDEASIAKEFFKQPIMEVSYSKDAGMFQAYLEEIFSRPEIEPYVREYLTADLFPTLEDITANANMALEASLNDAIDATSVKMLTKIGYAHAMINRTMNYKDANGDDVVVGSAVQGPIRLETLNTESNDYTEFEGFKFITNSYATVDVMSLDEFDKQDLIQIRRQKLAYDPGYAKPEEFFWDKKTQSYISYKTFAGSALSKQAGVMPNQRHDGSAMAATTLAISKNKSMPTPMLGVHDSVISTGSGGLRSRNAYNNIVIPRMADAIADTFPRIVGSLREAEKLSLDYIKMKGVTGIGNNGEHAAMGGYFDGMFFQWDDNGDYKSRVFMKKLDRSGKPRTEADWKEAQAKKFAVLVEAIKLGWIPPPQMDERKRANMAVTATQFEGLYNLFKVNNNIDGGLPEEFAKAKKENAKKVFQRLRQSTERHGGIRQMAAGGGESPKANAQDKVKATINNRRIKELPVKPTDTPAKAEVKAEQPAMDLLRNAYNKLSTPATTTAVPPLQMGVPVAEPPGLFADIDNQAAPPNPRAGRGFKDSLID